MKRLPYLLLILFLFGCEANNNSLAEFHLPVIAECEDKLVEFVDHGKFSEYLDGEVVRFTDPLSYSHLPNLVGYMIVHLKNRKTDDPKRDLQMILNNVLLGCYPTTRAYMSSEALGSEALEVLELHKLLGISENYLVLDEKELSIFHNDRDFH